METSEILKLADQIWSYSWLLILIYSLVCGGFTCAVADAKNRPSAPWFFAGFFFSIVALIAIAGMPSLPRRDNPEQTISGSNASPSREPIPPNSFDPDSIEAKLERLSALHLKGVVADADYSRLRDELVKEHAEKGSAG